MKSLKKQLVEDMKMAMKNDNEKKVSVIRMARAAIKNKEIEKRKELSDKEVIEVLKKKIKKHKESIIKYKEVDEEEKVKKLKKEIQLLNEYLREN